MASTTQTVSTHHATTLTMSSPMTMVREASMVVETSDFLKSQDTSGRSLTARMPLDLPLAASLNASFTCTGQQEGLAQSQRGYGRCQVSCCCPQGQEGAGLATICVVESSQREVGRMPHTRRGSQAAAAAQPLYIMRRQVSGKGERPIVQQAVLA